MQTCPGFFFKSLLEYPGNLLEICSVKSVDTLLNHRVVAASYVDTCCHHMKFNTAIKDVFSCVKVRVRCAQTTFCVSAVLAG